MASNNKKRKKPSRNKQTRYQRGLKPGPYASWTTQLMFRLGFGPKKDK